MVVCGGAWCLYIVVVRGGGRGGGVGASGR